MQISGATQSQSQYQALQAQAVQAPRSEESAEVVSGTREEAAEAPSIVKSAEQDRGIGRNVDVLA